MQWSMSSHLLVQESLVKRVRDGTGPAFVPRQHLFALHNHRERCSQVRREHRTKGTRGETIAQENVIPMTTHVRTYVRSLASISSNMPSFTTPRRTSPGAKLSWSRAILSRPLTPSTASRVAIVCLLSPVNCSVKWLRTRRRGRHMQKNRRSDCRVFSRNSSRVPFWSQTIDRPTHFLSSEDTTTTTTTTATTTSRILVVVRVVLFT